MARTELEQLVFQMDANVVKMTRAMEKASGSVDANAKRMQARFDRLGREAARSWEPVQRAAQVAFAGISFYAIRAASDAGETQNAFNVAFGKMSKDAQGFADVLADKVGRSVTDLQGGMSRMQLVMTGMGLSAGKALELTKALTERGIDIGSLWNVSDAEALQAIISGISGETEPMKRFGAVINETAVQAELLRLGFKGNAQEASDAAKAIARANLILEKTQSAMGDAGNTADSTANQFKRAQGEFKDAAIALGTQLLPAVTDATKAGADLVHQFGELPGSVQLGGLALLGFAAASGPVAKVIASLIALVKYAGAARVALAGIAGAGLAGSLGVAVVAPMALSGDTVRGDAKVKAQRELNTLLAQELQYSTRLQALDKPRTESERREKARLTRWVDQVRNSIDKRNTILFGGGSTQVQPSASAAAEEAKAAMAALQGQFSLNGVLSSAPGGKGSKGHKPKADGPKLADPISGSTFIEDRPINTGPITDVMGGPTFDVSQFIADLKQIVGLSGDAASSIAEIRKRTEDGLIDPEVADAMISDLQGIDDQIVSLMETTKAWGASLTDEVGRAIGDASVGFDDLGDAFQNVVRRMMSDMVASGFRDMMRNLFTHATASTGTGWGATAARAVGKFLGFAKGTDSAPGGLAIVGEEGPEIMNVPKGAQVIPNDILRSLSGARRSMTMAGARQGASFTEVRLAMDLTGANGDATIRRIAGEAARMAFGQAVAASNRSLPAQQTRFNLLGSTS